MTSPLHFSSPEMAQRVEKVRRSMAQSNLDGLLCLDAANVRYLTGFRGEPRTLLILSNELILFTSFRTLPWAREQTTLLGDSLEISTAPNPVEDLKTILPAESQKLGIDQHTLHRTLLGWQKELTPHSVQTTDLVETVRQQKSPAEVALMQESQRINEDIFHAVIPKIRPGMTERGIQGLILSEMASREEVDRYSFMPIVAAGPSCWEIHHLPDQTVTRPGDLLLIDLGVIHQGYASDMTRVVCLGKATDEMHDIHHVVNSARQAAIDALAPGVTNHTIDRIARNLITEAGHGRSFTHGLGHSIGLETHDPGLNLSPNAPGIELKEGMALTVEPGIYLENNFGIRIEDTVVITSTGSKNLTSQSPKLIELDLE